MAHLTFAVDCALTQHLAGREFLLEHPAAATSWKTRELQDLGSRAGVYSVVFDQCTTGLVSPCSGTPMRKRTKLMSNSMHFIEAFRGNMCDRSHLHQLIQGSEGGIRLSVWCQCYPAPMVGLWFHDTMTNMWPTDLYWSLLPFWGHSQISDSLMDPAGIVAGVGARDRAAEEEKAPLAEAHGTQSN